MSSLTISTIVKARRDRVASSVMRRRAWLCGGWRRSEVVRDARHAFGG